jgi:hypothetical protein
VSVPERPPALLEDRDECILGPCPRLISALQNAGKHASAGSRTHVARTMAMVCGSRPVVSEPRKGTTITGALPLVTPLDD